MYSSGWHVFGGGNAINSSAVLVKRTGKRVNKVQEGTGQTVSMCEVCEAHHIKQWATKNARYIKNQLNEKRKNAEADCPVFQLGIWPNLGVWEAWVQKVTAGNGMAEAHTDTALPLQHRYCCISGSFVSHPGNNNSSSSTPDRIFMAESCDWRIASSVT